MARQDLRRAFVCGIVSGCLVERGRLKVDPFANSQKRRLGRRCQRAAVAAQVREAGGGARGAVCSTQMADRYARINAASSPAAWISRRSALTTSRGTPRRSKKRSVSCAAT
jgi:hypothetical protein